MLKLPIDCFSAVWEWGAIFFSWSQSEVVQNQSTSRINFDIYSVEKRRKFIYDLQGLKWGIMIRAVLQST